MSRAKAETRDATTEIVWAPTGEIIAYPGPHPFCIVGGDSHTYVHVGNDAEGRWIYSAGLPGRWSPPPQGPTAATGATAGSPGTFTPSGADVPADLAAMTGIVASPATAWTTGQHVVLDDASQAYWDGAAWVAGVAP